jgi:hypothetical protein
MKSETRYRTVSGNKKLSYNKTILWTRYICYSYSMNLKKEHLLIYETGGIISEGMFVTLSIYEFNGLL